MHGEHAAVSRRHVRRPVRQQLQSVWQRVRQLRHGSTALRRLPDRVQQRRGVRPRQLPELQSSGWMYHLPVPGRMRHRPLLRLSRCAELADLHRRPGVSMINAAQATTFGVHDRTVISIAVIALTVGTLAFPTPSRYSVGSAMPHASSPRTVGTHRSRSSYCPPNGSCGNVIFFQEE